MEYAMWPMGLRGLGKERIQQHISLRGPKLCAKTKEPEYHHKVLGEVNVDDLLGAISDLCLPHICYTTAKLDQRRGWDNAASANTKSSTMGIISNSTGALLWERSQGEPEE
jgi:hypothetical protein